MILANDFSSGLIRFQKLLAQMANRVLLDLARAAQIILDLGGWNVGRFLSALLFPSGDQCCDALACPCSEVPQASERLLPCKAADKISAVFASLSACSFTLTPACPGQ